MGKVTWGIIFGAGLMFSIEGAVIYNHRNEEQEIKRNFAAATAEDQLASVRHGQVKIICPDKATQTTYEDKSIQTAGELLEKYQKGCTAFYSGNGHEFFIK